MTLTANPGDTVSTITRPDERPHAAVPTADAAATSGSETDDAPPRADVDATTGQDSEPVGELLRVDPRTLVIGANVRRDVVLDRPFLRSITDRGVREPIIVRRDDHGVLVVRKGKRRTLAAVETGRPTVPVLVESGRPGEDPDAEDRGEVIDRIVDQLEENHHRAATHEADEVRAHQQLLDLGLTAGQIARRTHVPNARVKQTTAVARSEIAAAAMERYDLTLDQVAVIAEFDGPDGPDVEAVKALTVTAAKEPAQFAHVAQRLRDQRADARQVADTVAELTNRGVRVLDPEDTGGAAQISGLRLDAQTPSGTEFDPTTHSGCPGHAATVEVHRSWDRQPQVKVVHWCTAPDEHGHVARWGRVTPTDDSGGGGDGEVARELAQAAEQAKAERRRVIANNRDWASATSVRRDWMRGLLARRAAPRDALPYIATTLARGGHDLRRAMESGHPTACELLGLTPTGSVYAGSPNPIEALTATATSARATQLILAVLLGAAEDASGRQTWRNPTRDNRAYFTALRDWGYPLSPVEQLVLTDDDAATPSQPADTTTPAEATRPAEDGSQDCAVLDAVTEDGMSAAEKPSTT
ncbi:ParB N-terminal domain-containing protein [Pseudonocardia sp. N23]|uniref:ParB/RepB/Spo0J family partition protein n=1 Tax=Pseudonocardia sp. N23 TaxID=1987376 RepID=UPI000BFE7ADD|nr:ParB N-terminal domain-containing protein [Pseudonocardia sp. N23]GAY11424.1 chromosome (plasmid) partitioning protein ParB [Pseudonocardia sp. N23]